VTPSRSEMYRAIFRQYAFENTNMVAAGLAWYCDTCVLRPYNEGPTCHCCDGPRPADLTTQEIQLALLPLW